MTNGHFHDLLFPLLRGNFNILFALYVAFHLLITGTNAKFQFTILECVSNSSQKKMLLTQGKFSSLMRIFQCNKSIINCMFKVFSEYVHVHLGSILHSLP